MESNDDTANAERILFNITPKALIDVIKEAFEQGEEMDNESENQNAEEKKEIDIKLENEDNDDDDDDETDDSDVPPPREVGHNLYILAHKLAKFNKELSVALKMIEGHENRALAYYAAHTAQIEIIRDDRCMEQIVYPVPTICEYLTKETKQRIFLTTEKDEQNSKITGFFESVDAMWNEMKWQKKLRQQTWLYWFSSHMSLWSDITFNFSVLINLLVAIFYPFDKTIRGMCRIMMYILFLLSSF
jgi:inositol 1,4,5-triphosphate receptor type 1